MQSVEIITMWNESGIGPVEEMIREQMKSGEIQDISGLDVLRLLKLKKQTSLFHKPEIDFSKINASDTYYLYYNYHRSTGYKSQIKKDEQGKFEVEVNQPKSGFCAFCSEVIIFH